MTIEETRNLAIEFERRIQQIHPDFSLKGKLTSDVIYAMLNEYQNVYFKQMVLADDQNQSGTRQQRLVDDSIAKFIKSTYIEGTVVGNTYYFHKLNNPTIPAPTTLGGIPLTATDISVVSVVFFQSVNLFYVQATYYYEDVGKTTWFKIRNGKCVTDQSVIEITPKLDAKYPQNSKVAVSNDYYVCTASDTAYQADESGSLVQSELPISDEHMDKYTTVFDAPSDYYAYIRSSSVLSKSYKQETAYTEGNYPVVPNIQVKHNEIVAVFDTIYNNGGIIKNPLLVQHGSQFHLVCDKYTQIIGLNLQYYRNPNTFDLSTPCEFPTRCFNDLVQGAVDMYISNYKFKLAGGGQKQEPKQGKEGAE